MGEKKFDFTVPEIRVKQTLLTCGPQWILKFDIRSRSSAEQNSVFSELFQ